MHILIEREGGGGGGGGRRTGREIEIETETL